MSSGNFDSVLRGLRGKKEDKRLALCPEAQTFLQKVEDVVFDPLAHLGGRVTRGHIAMAKVYLLDTYMAWKKSTPPHHSFGQHKCLVDVFEENYDRLHLMELERRPLLNIILDYDDLSSRSSSGEVGAKVYKGIVLGFEDDG